MKSAWLRISIALALLLVGLAAGYGLAGVVHGDQDSQAVQLEELITANAGFEGQPHMASTILSAQKYGYQPGTTGWHPLPRANANPDIVQTEDVLYGIASGKKWASPEALLLALAEELVSNSFGDCEASPELTLRLKLTGDSAVGMVLRWGLCDDSVAGQDYRVTLNRDGEDGWVLEQMEVRQHCWRGVSEDRCL